jgi:hypothetical protein
MLAELVSWRNVLNGGYGELVGQLSGWYRHESALDDGIATTPFAAADVVDIAWLDAGSPDGPPWIAIVQLADGRWVYTSYTVEITGDVRWTYVFAASHDRLWFWACTDDDRERFWKQLTPEQRDDELVCLDLMLDSPHERVRWVAERRMRTRIG